MIVMYITMMPLILSGIMNMIFTKTTLYNKYKIPIDRNKTFRGKRILGDNKTVIGLISMTVFCCISQVIWGMICSAINLDGYNETYTVFTNNITFNSIVGALYGFVYMISELPNSFIKRQLDIESGKTAEGLKGIIFFIVDQIDSLIGVMAILCIIAKLPFLRYIEYIVLGGLTHIIINLTLYKLHIRRNI